MLQTEVNSDKGPEKENSNQTSDELKQNSKDSNIDPLLISQRNNKKLNSIIEEVRHLLEVGSK